MWHVTKVKRSTEARSGGKENVAGTYNFSKKLRYSQIMQLVKFLSTVQMKLGTREQLELPQLIDSILADKNEEIDHLKEQLSKKEKQLEAYSSIAVGDTQLKDVTKAEPKDSARTLSDILSIHSECEELPEAIRASNVTLIHVSHNISSFKVPGSTLSKNTLKYEAIDCYFLFSIVLFIFSFQ